MRLGFVTTVASTKVEVFCWTTTLFSQTLGTALGHWLADSNGLDYDRGAFIFAPRLVVVSASSFFTKASRTLLFWAASFSRVHSRATVGDLLDKPPAQGRLGVGRLGIDRQHASARL